MIDDRAVGVDLTGAELLIPLPERHLIRHIRLLRTPVGPGGTG